MIVTIEIWFLFCVVVNCVIQRYAPHPTYMLASLSMSVASCIQWLTTPSVESAIFELTPLILTLKNNFNVN